MEKGKVKKFLKEHYVELVIIAIGVGGTVVLKNYYDKKSSALVDELKNDARFRVTRDLLTSMNESKGFSWNFNMRYKLSDLGKVGEDMLATCPDETVTMDSDLGAIVFTLKK